METEEKQEYITIRDMFGEKCFDVLDNNKCQIFNFVYDGDLWAATKKKPCRVTIMIPRTIVGDNLKDLDKYILLGVAIPREELKSEDGKNE